MFALLGGFAKKYNGLFFAIMAAFGIFAVFVCCYQHPMFAWMYGESETTNVFLTLIAMPIFLAIAAVVFYAGGTIMDRAIEKESRK